jgi:F0F1-type ATP synthase membrane subunit b/b'
MFCLLFKFAYKRLDGYLDKRAKDVENRVNSLEKRKLEIEGQLAKLRDDFQDIILQVDNMIKDSEVEAQKIMEKSSMEINEMVNSKRLEYKAVTERIEQKFLTETQSKMVSLMAEALFNKLLILQNNKEAQNIGVENSIKIFEEVHKKYTKH